MKQLIYIFIREVGSIKKEDLNKDMNALKESKFDVPHLTKLPRTISHSYKSHSQRTH